MLDVTKATTGVSMSSDDVSKLPLPRDFYSVAQITTGSARDAIGTTFYGSTGAENTYNIEGLNITGGRYGTESKALNFDFIQEVEVKTGGLTAEYGRLTGGLINAITKSGSNDFQANVFGFYEDGSDNSTENELTSTAASVKTLDTNVDYGFSLGGAFVQDKLWYFAAYTRKELSEDHDITAPIAQIPGQAAPPAEGSVFGNDVSTDLYSGKLTWAMTPEAHACRSRWSAIPRPPTASSCSTGRPTPSPARPRPSTASRTRAATTTSAATTASSAPAS